jgi:phosphoribosylformylglycinamidine cyclo-ligase
MSEELVYSGKLRLSDNVPVTYSGADGKTVRELIPAGLLALSPTRTYAPVIRDVLTAMRGKIHGMVHCSGGGQTKVLHFIRDGVHVVKDNLFEIPPLFEIIREQSGATLNEMYRVFNMGHRMEIYTDAESAEEIIRIAKKYNIEAKTIGRVATGNGKKVILHTAEGILEYS